MGKRQRNRDRARGVRKHANESVKAFLKRIGKRKKPVT